MSTNCKGLETHLKKRAWDNSRLILNWKKIFTKKNYRIDVDPDPDSDLDLESEPIGLWEKPKDAGQCAKNCKTDKKFIRWE